MIISATQKLNVDWTRFGRESAAIGVLGLLVNPTFGLQEIFTLLTGTVHIASSYSEIQDSTTEVNAKALLFKVLIDKGYAKIENEQLYLCLK